MLPSIITILIVQTVYVTQKRKYVLSLGSCLGPMSPSELLLTLIDGASPVLQTKVFVFTNCLTLFNTVSGVNPRVF